MMREDEWADMNRPKLDFTLLWQTRVIIAAAVAFS